jgi:anti-sigma-K factor RskA
MEPRDLHALTAAYALDALDGNDAAAYEAHLGQCQRCRTELATLSETAGALAWAPHAPAPPPRLRAAILDAAAATRVNVVPLPTRRSWAFRAAAPIAAAAACAAIALGVWAGILHSRLAHKTVLSAVLVLGSDRRATLSVAGLARAPDGKTYEAWVIRHGVSPQPAGLFPGGSASTVRLRRPVPPGATVAVTLEHAGGVTSPTGRPLLSAQA